jgi:hypothetical protein
MHYADVILASVGQGQDYFVPDKRPLKSVGTTENWTSVCGSLTIFYRLVSCLIHHPSEILNAQIYSFRKDANNISDFQSAAYKGKP